MLEEFEKQCKIEEWCSIIDYKFESDLEWFLRIEEKDNIEEISYEELEEFNLDSSQYLNQEFCLSQLEKKHKKSKANHKEKLDELIQLAETTQIIGEDPIKHWERNKILAHLDIKNSDFNIRTQKIEYTPTYREEFEKQVEKLLKLEVIRDSNSRHRSLAFMVRNHAEVKRGKTRMVINYKRLNDNINTDSYDMPSKEELINCIQHANIFSKFDCN